MTRRTKIYFAVMLGLTAVCVIMGIVTRGSYAGYADFEQMAGAENLAEYAVGLSEVEVDDPFSAQVGDGDELEEQADLVAKVSATGDRQIFPRETTKTKVMVDEVYKGDVEKGELLYIYEPAAFFYSVSKAYYSVGGYQLMETGEEYYVFLQKLKTPKGYRMSEEEEATYLPCTAEYSKFPVREGTLELVDREKLDEGGYRYGEIADREILTSEQNVLSLYQKIKGEVMEKILAFGN